LPVCALLLPLVLAAPSAQHVRGRNLVENPGFERRAQWEPVGAGFTYDGSCSHSGRQSMCCTGSAPDSVHGACQTVTLDPPVKAPFRVSGWSLADGAVVGQDYNVYLDLRYDDGTPLWGMIAPFEPGTHDWQYAERVFDVDKPVSSISVFVLFRQARGTVWFDDIKVELLPFGIEDLTVVPGLFGDGLGVAARVSMPCDWTATLESGGRVLAETTGTGRHPRLTWAHREDEPAIADKATLIVAAADPFTGETVQARREVRLPRAVPASRKGYAVWTESSMRRVLPSAFPPPDVGRPAADIALAGNEWEGFQVVLLAPPGRPLEGVRVGMSDLVCRRTGARIDAGSIEWDLVGYVKVGRINPSPAYPEAEPGWWPDPLLTVDRFSVPPDFAQPIWVTVYAPPGTPAGDYEGTLTVRPAGEPATAVQVRARIYGFDLPRRGHMKTAFALMDGYLEQVYGKPLPPDIRRRYGDFVLRHRLNPDDISRTEPPPIDDLLHYRDDGPVGLNAFNVLNMVEERGNSAWVCWSPLDTYTPAFRQGLIARLDPYVAELRKAGLTDLAYIYTFDERGEEFFPVIREYFGLVKERYPEIRTLTTAYTPLDPDVLADLNVDWACPLTPRYDVAAADRCRARGRQVWAYVCLGPRYPYANWLADDPLIEARAVWWQAFRERMDGFLYWGLNIWDRPHNDRPIDPARGQFLDWSITTGGDYDWLHGDGRLIYAGPDGPIGSIRLANIRDGLEDYEYLWMLRSAGSNLAEAQCERVTISLTKFTRDCGALTAARNTAAIALSKH